ncbi:isoprenylcysteine carboxylmethyltransferase family protein [Sphingosinicella sp. CPCC 101087]|uniref:methyltransferase family protein n=1 Tax=Sphingosinicella sp. CPCC 101087 TaxID=2497754 RepID=UPI00101D4E42|nr:isoprenylcysteine carboxylmethyltransferase family protein [Sphingosinicella sp. CPCC 101087]
MSTLVIVLRVVSLLAFAATMLLTDGGRDRKRSRDGDQRRGDRVPVTANFAAFGLFLALLATFTGDPEDPAALPLALCGCLFALVGAAFVLRSRAALGAAWSFVPVADRRTGPITTGPYRLVRHPIYLGLSLWAMGVAVAFSNWATVATVFCAILPTFLWRARAEEKLLAATFGERYAHYQALTKMMIPYLL